MRTLKRQFNEPALLKSFVPRSLIAGSLPLAKGAVPLQVAYNAACLALDSERIALIVSASGNTVHYLAGLAADFASAGPVTCWLAGALPGSAHHQGPGAYYCPLDEHGLTACVLCTEDGVKCFVGSADDVKRFPASERVPDCRAFEATDPVGAAWPRWHAYTEYAREDNRTLLRRLVQGGLAACAIMLVLWVAAAVYLSWANAQSTDLAAKARRIVDSAQQAFAENSGNRDPAWIEFQNLARFVLEHQGRLVAFEHKGGKSSWTLEVPEFTTGEEISRAFGPGVQTHKEGNRIQVSKKGDDK